MQDFKSMVEIKDVFATAETMLALLCIIDGEEHWIPKAQIDANSEVWKNGDEGTLIISEWIAEQKGLV